MVIQVTYLHCNKIFLVYKNAWSSEIDLYASSHTLYIFIPACKSQFPLLFYHSLSLWFTNTQKNLCCSNFHHYQDGSTYEKLRFLFKRKDKEVFKKYDKYISGYWMFPHSMQNHKYFKNYDGHRLIILKYIFIAKKVWD